MCRSVALIFATGVFLVPFFSPRSFGASEDLKNILDKTTPAVMRITVTHQGGDEVSVGTGFLCHDRKSVVTAYHLVAGAEKVLVQTAPKTSPGIAKIWKVQKPSDLALLTLEDAATANPLPMGEAPKEGAQVLSLGHAYGAPAVESLTQMKIREVGAKTLSDMLNENHRQEIERLGFPDLGLNLLNIEGNPAPGFSGAPVIDTSGRVIGVIDGGLESGAGSVSWAIPAKQIDALFAQDETVTRESNATVQQSRLLYAADLRASEGPEVTLRVNGFQLVKRRTRTLGEMQQTADDPVGLQQILSAFGWSGFSLDSLQFDIYEHEQSGACVVVPEGLKLQEELNGISSGKLDGGRFLLAVRLESFRNEADKIRAANRFDEIMGGLYPGVAWQRIAANSYTMAQLRPDGALVMRKAELGTTVFQGHKYSFETLAARRGMNIGIAAVNESHTGWLNAEETRQWAALILAVHLSQFSR